MIASRVFLLLGTLFLLAVPLPAQRVTSSIVGRVEDASRGVVQGAEIHATALATQFVRTAVSGDDGHYAIAGLLPGNYKVEVRKAGFDTAVRRLKLLVNEEVVADFELEVGSIEASVTVSGAPPLVDTRSATLSGVVTEESLSELPLNGRDLFQLVTLETGVVPSTNAGPNPWSDGGITKASVQGARATMNNVTLDGGDINDPGFNVPPGGPSGAQLGVEAVQEFRVLLNNYSAEFGRNGGANVQFVTKSGGNRFHGSAYEFHRNAALDARNFFDLGETPPFVRHQFGASLGGPIRQDRSFFFANYEGLREGRSINSGTAVPDDNARAGLLPSASDPTRLLEIGVDPRVRPLLELFPRANGGPLGGGLAVLQVSRLQDTREDYIITRVDRNFSRGDQLIGRYVFDDGESLVPFQSTLVPGFEGRRRTRSQYLMLGWLRVLSPNTLNEVRFHLNRTRLSAEAANSYPLSISLSPNRALGAVAIAGLPLLGNNVIYPLGTASNVFEIIDNLSAERGKHSLALGADLKRMHINGPFDLFIDGQYTFADLTPFGVPAASANTPLEFFLRGQPFFYIGVDPALADSHRGYRQNYFGLYLQDNWRAHPRLTLNLGLRWEYSSNPSEVNGRTSNIRNLASDTAPTPGDIWESVPLNLFSPRFGFAWSPWRRGETVVRGGVGVFRDQLWANLYFDTRFYEPFYRAFLSVLPNFATPPPSLDELGGVRSIIGSAGVTYRPDFPYFLQYNVSLQRQLGGDLALTVAYAGSRGIHLPRLGEANLTPQGPINGNFGSVPQIVTDANSVYDSLQISLLKRATQGLAFQVSYTLAKSIDDASAVFPSDWVSETGVSQDFFNRAAERGRSSFDRRHVLVGNFLYDLPFGSSSTKAAGKVLSGWQIGGIATLMSGLPFTANLGAFNNSGTLASLPGDRPDLRSGASPCGGGPGTPDRWFDPTIFVLPPAGAYGDAGRNILCGPKFVNFDFVAKKSTKLSERVSLEFRTEIFNLFNRPNFSTPVNTQSPAGNGGAGEAIFVGRRGGDCDSSQDPLGCGVLSPSAGRIFSTANSSRQIQFALKLVF